MKVFTLLKLDLYAFHSKLKIIVSSNFSRNTDPALHQPNHTAEASKYQPSIPLSPFSLPIMDVDNITGVNVRCPLSLTLHFLLLIPLRDAHVFDDLERDRSICAVNLKPLIEKRAGCLIGKIRLFLRVTAAAIRS